MSKKPDFVKYLLHILGFSLCILPPLLATLNYFPLWIERGGQHALAGGTALLLALCMLPLYKYIGRILRSAASYTVWLIIFVIFFSLSRIAEEMTVISFMGFVGNILGAVCFRIAKGGRRK